MPWVGDKNEYPFPIVGLEPDGNISYKVAKHPRGGTIRTDGRRRWASEPLMLPLASRIFGRVNYNNTGYPQGALDPNFEYFWTDLYYAGPNRIEGSLPPSAHGTTYRHVCEYYDIMPSTGVRGVRVTQYIGVSGEPSIERYSEYPDMKYDQGHTALGGPPFRDPPDSDDVGTQWPYIYAQWAAISECFPTDKLPKGKDMNLTAGVIAHLQTSQSINSTTFLNILAPEREIGGVWWDPLGPGNEIVIPEPWNKFKASIHFTTGSARQNSIWVGIWQNGSNPFGCRCVVADRLSGTAQNSDLNAFTPDWIDCTPGDKITFRAQQTGGQTSTTKGNCWIQVRGEYWAL